MEKYFLYCCFAVFSSLRLTCLVIVVFILQLCGGKLSEGLFVGALLSMSSTAVVLFSFYNS